MVTAHTPLSESYFIRPGFIYLASEATVISAVVGSGVSVCLFDRKSRVGSMSHFTLPQVTNPKESTAIYGNVSTYTLIRMMFRNGSHKKHMEAQIIGGAFNPDVSDIDIGGQNIRIARSILQKAGIRIVSEDVGGAKGRKIVFDTAANEIAVMKVDRLRQEDWYPYAGNR